MRLRSTGITITVRTAPWYVRGEPAALERAVVNLLDNAVKFSPDGGTVEVVLSDGTLRVRDHGPGITEDELPYVFDRFWRSPSARSLPGSGLGLSIVARTVQRAGGEVDAGTGGGRAAARWRCCAAGSAGAAAGGASELRRAARAAGERAVRVRARPERRSLTST